MSSFLTNQCSFREREREKRGGGRELIKWDIDYFDYEVNAVSKQVLILKNMP